MLNIVTDLSTNITKIVVPAGVRFISDWSDYSLADFQFPHILDKKLPGCGYTEYCIRCNLDVIVVSPRRMLLENKEAQHLGDIYYFRNDREKLVDFEKDLNNSNPDTKKNQDGMLDIDGLAYMLAKEQEVIEYCTRRDINRQPLKILVTYDSYGFLKRILCKLGYFERFYTVIDEFQSILVDSKFKSTVELTFMKELLPLRRVCYVSATPMIYEYISQLEIFNKNNFRYFELDWSSAEPERLISPNLEVRSLESINKSSSAIIKSYLDGNFARSWVSGKFTQDGNGYEIESREAVFFVNSVKNIISIISKSGLKPEQCNILCARTEENEKRIRARLGKKFVIGSVPLLGEPHKMFTFCTRTVYLGADFYSTNARTFIFSDANVDSLAVDITLDLPQILGRQRLDINPWKNSAIIYVKPLAKGKSRLTREEFNKIINKKIVKTENLLANYREARDELKKDIAEKYADNHNNYMKDYVSEDIRGKDIILSFNNLVMLSEQRAFDIQQVDYKDRFTIFNNLKNLEIEKNINVSGFEIDKLGWRDINVSFADRFRDFCESTKYTDQEKEYLSTQVSDKFGYYYNTLSDIERKRCRYSITAMDRYMTLRNIEATSTSKIIKDNILVGFEVGKRYCISDIKESLKELYNKYNYSKTAKATDLYEFFKIKEVMLQDSVTKKRIRGFEIISKR